jgi:hypothetical protein
MASQASYEQLAVALEALSRGVASSPRSVIGMKVSAVAGPGSSGNVTGLKVDVRGGPGGGNVTGLHVQASAGGPDPAAPLIQEVKDAAAAVRKGNAQRSWVQGIVGRVQSLADRAVDATLVGAVEQGIKVVFG